ncbi:ABC transporter substrate-binding protein [Marivita geojedonensis]|uniref:ABC transporter substrate-binding protein n=1 Tax=Marivita geojedonensis TaxID=1123756 RepID=A0A1X4NR81_9RHOB|nr:ABC transporter substrate-binding protein [Marivita geojedonensis]OSQ53386.1 ABC transporter substrate-binding protein [Marivita geojedonensis]PRY81637.1 amino acid ABC transporter substrate-binding protein (PAAT family) [Marivita geojedonensis]
MSRFLTLTAVLAVVSTSAMAGGHCAAGKTLEDGKLTIATGNPAYYPWVLNDAPESGEGFEAAVAYAVAAEMGFADEDVVWVRSSFDEAIQPGAKNFNFNMQQYSITAERDAVVDFSVPYYTAPMAVLVSPGATETEPTLAALRGLKWGAVGSTTAVPKLETVIQPDSAPLLYGDNADVNAAMSANQIDAALFDLPTALFLSAVMIEGSKVIGQFAPDESDNPDQFGMLMEQGNPLKACVDEALNAMKDSGKLAEIEAQWLQDTTGVPLIK